MRRSESPIGFHHYAPAAGENPLPTNDPLSKVKEYAWEGYNYAHAGSRENFEHLWAEAFDDLFHLGRGIGCS